MYYIHERYRRSITFRKFRISSANFEEFKQIVSTIVKVDAEQYNFHYIDEHDKIRITSDLELACALTTSSPLRVIMNYDQQTTEEPKLNETLENEVKVSEIREQIGEICRTIAQTNQQMHSIKTTHKADAIKKDYFAELDDDEKSQQMKLFQLSLDVYNLKLKRRSLFMQLKSHKRERWGKCTPFYALSSPPPLPPHVVPFHPPHIPPHIPGDLSSPFFVPHQPAFHSHVPPFQPPSFHAPFHPPHGMPSHCGHFGSERHQENRQKMFELKEKMHLLKLQIKSVRLIMNPHNSEAQKSELRSTMLQLKSDLLKLKEEKISLRAQFHKWHADHHNNHHNDQSVNNNNVNHNQCEGTEFPFLHPRHFPHPRHPHQFHFWQMKGENGEQQSQHEEWIKEKELCRERRLKMIELKRQVLKIKAENFHSNSEDLQALNDLKTQIEQMKMEQAQWRQNHPHRRFFHRHFHH